MKYDFDELIDRRNTNSIKYSAGCLANPYLPKKHIPMWIADMDFAVPEPIIAAMRARLDKRILGYSDFYDPAYFRSITGWFKRRYDWDVAPETILFSNGIVPAINVCVELLTASREGVIFMTPAYHPYDIAVKRYGRRPVYNAMIDQGGYYTVDFADLAEKAKSPKNTLLFLCHPQNPTGRVFTEEELVRIGEICFSNNVFVVSDEIHADLLRTGLRHIPLAKLFPNENRLITCTSPSKTFNSAGNQLANLVIPDANLRSAWKHHELTGLPNPLSIDAAKAAYDKCENWLEQLKRYLDANFAFMKEYLEKNLPQAKFRIPEGTYLAWVDLTAFGLPDAELNRRISEAGVFVQFADSFVHNAEGHIRVNIACPKLVLEWGLQKICNALSE